MIKYDYSQICRHVDSETESTTLKLTGSYPSWLNGLVIYNGPGLTKVKDQEYKHAFDSSAILQKFEIHDGKVNYSTKYLQSETYKKNKKAGSITIAEFGTPGPTSKGTFSRLLDTMDSEKMMSDNAVLGIVKMGEKFFALGETPFYLEVDPKTLDVINRVNMNKPYKLATQSIHILQDEEGFYYTMGQAVGLTGPKYSILKFPPNGDIEKGKSMVSIPCRWRLSPCYIHSFAFTKNYVVLIEPPLSVSIMELLSGVMSNSPFIEGLHWQNEKTLIHIIDRQTWKVLPTHYVSDPFFFLHFCNAYEEGNFLVFDVCGYNDASMMQNMFINTLRGAKNVSPEFHALFCASLQRFVVPLQVNFTKKGEEQLITLSNTSCSATIVNKEVHLKWELLTSLPFENPVINPTYLKSKNRYIWAMGPCPEGGNLGHIVKIDTESRETRVFKEEDFYPAAPIFVPQPQAKAEDEGILIMMGVKSSNERLVTLVFLDASTLREICRATAEVNAAVPTPLHGGFFPSS